MIRVSQLKMIPGQSMQELEDKIRKTLRLRPNEVCSWTIFKKSLDARKKPDLFEIYTVDVSVANENAVLKRCKNNVTKADITPYQMPKSGDKILQTPPVVIGCGPAGLFCTYMLAKAGYRPILLERGKAVEERARDVEVFWKTGKLHPNSNVQFGEGGAGTFSDGKLNTLVKDKYGRNRLVLEVFVEHGASPEILYENKPHIGTDVLVDILKNMRTTILSCGGQIYFEHQVTNFEIIEKHGQKYLTSLVINHEKRLPAEAVVLAPGHSARDTFETLHQLKVPMEAKAFAIGVRVEHDQETIDQSQYGQSRGEYLPAAAYKVAANLENGRGVYSFCMCPGGYVVNASSEDGRLAVNGMSYSDRAGKNANSAIIVTVTPEDFGGNAPLDGIHFQRKLEEKAYQLGNGKIPVQRFGDFCKNQKTEHLGKVKPQLKGKYAFANLRELFPEAISASLMEGICTFEQKIEGFSDPDTVLSGVESRTSSPLRILRDDTLQSEIQGLYPCGEGAGYAGGITSAAMDGIKIAEAIIQKYQPLV